MHSAVRAFPGRLIFDHLPKTAGQAVNAWLRECLGAGCVTESLIGQHRALINQFGGQYSIISAHVEFQGDGLDPRYDYVTCFRHPVDRAISWIYFVLENHGDQEIVDLRAGVREFLDSNGQRGAEFIGGNSVTDHLCSVFEFKSNNADQRVEHALSVLEDFAVWGLYEQLPVFISDFADLLGVPAPASLGTVNKTVKRPELNNISPSLRARIEEINSLDIALYEQLNARYADSRKRWYRPKVDVSKWQPFQRRVPRQWCDPDFVLLSVSHEGGSNINQRAVLTFKIHFSLARAVDILECGIHIHDQKGARAFGTNSTLCHTIIGPLQAGSHQVTHSILAALPEDGYDVGFAFAEITPDSSKQLAWFDKLTSFRISLVRQPMCAGHLSLPAVIGHRFLNDRVVRLASEGKGHMSFIDPVNQVLAGEQWQQPVHVANESPEDWVGVYSHPLNVSYHWLDSNRQISIFDGIRNAFPNGMLRAGASTKAQIMVDAPKVPGVYTLQAMPIQESHAWFDSLGFTAGEMRVEVVGHRALRRYAADDGRLFSQVGQRVAGARTSNGQEGFLVYGPYTTLAAGPWKIRWLGQFDPKIGQIQADVVCNDGTICIGLTSLSAVATEISLDVVVSEDMSRVEFRMWLDPNAVASLHSIELIPQ